MDNSVITSDECIEETKTVLTNFNEKNVTHKTQNFHILLTFSLITTVLLRAVSIDCCLIKYQGKQKKLVTISRQKVTIDNINKKRVINSKIF